MKKHFLINVPNTDFLLRLWNSSTIMTWLSYLTKSANILLILPLILKKFEAEEIAVWYLFATILAMSGLADLGFRNTFVRLIAHAMGGVKDIMSYVNGRIDGAEISPNWQLVEKLFSAMKIIYKYITILVFFILLFFGTLAMIKPIKDAGNSVLIWYAWGIIIIGISAEFYGKIYVNYLEGLFKIALVRRYETFFKIGSIISNLLVLKYSPSILNLALINSLWMIINLYRNKYLANKVYNKQLKYFTSSPLEKDFFFKIWSPAWRGGISGLMSNGLTNLTSIIYAQVGDSALVASYTVALRLITEIRNVSNAPLYSKIPLLSRLRANGDLNKLKHIAQNGMRIAHYVFICGVIVIALFFEDFITLFNSNIHFVEPKFWLLLSLAFYIHRYGAMHMQVYLTTNHVITHIADGVSGSIFILTSIILLNRIGLYSIPIGMIIGYLGFYSWYSAYHSLKSLNSSFFKYELSVSIFPILAFFMYCIISLI